MDALKLFERLLVALQPALDWSHQVNRDEWDRHVFTPAAAGESRGVFAGELAELAHRRFTTSEVGDLIAELSTRSDELPELERLIVARLALSHGRATLLPSEFVRRSGAAYGTAHATWVAAKKASDFASFAPALATVFDLKREEAGYLGANLTDPDSMYTAHLEAFEPGMTVEAARTVLNQVRDWLVPFLARIRESGQPQPSDLLAGDFPLVQQRELARELAATLGFDLNRGSLAEAEHPFCTTCGLDDFRLTSHYYPDAFNRGFFAAIHEAGHMMLEQGMPLAVRRAKANSVLYSLGIHESQSRLWENMVGRSQSFLRFILPRLQQYFPALTGVTAKGLYASVNRIEPGLIRVFADEVTYNLHIIIRFELEQALLSGELAAADLPAAWNEKYQAYLGITPPDDRQGVLQDVHWSMGYVGYFLTYTLGNLLAAQLMASYSGLGEWETSQQLDDLLAWLRQVVHERGAVLSLDELAFCATGESLNPEHWFRYVEKKFGPLYGLAPAAAAATA